MAKLLAEEEEGDESFYTEQFGEDVFRDEDSEFTSSEEESSDEVDTDFSEVEEPEAEEVNEEPMEEVCAAPSAYGLASVWPPPCLIVESVVDANLSLYRHWWLGVNDRSRKRNRFTKILLPSPPRRQRVRRVRVACCMS